MQTYKQKRKMDVFLYIITVLQNRHTQAYLPQIKITFEIYFLSLLWTLYYTPCYSRLTIREFLLHYLLL